MGPLLWGVFFYYLMANIVAIIVTVRDKVAVVNHRSQNEVSEQLLMALGILSGGIGMMVTILVTHHTELWANKKFKIGLPVAFVAEVLILLIVCIAL